LAVLHGVVNDEAADVEVADPVPVFLRVGGGRGLGIGRGRGKDELRDAVAEAEGFEQGLGGALLGVEGDGLGLRGLGFRRGLGCERCGSKQERGQGASKFHFASEINFTTIV
jgi:hypothetical protein